MTSVRTWIEPNTATHATAPVTRPTATGTKASSTRQRRSASNRTSTMPIVAPDPIQLLSATACALPAAAYSAPPATSIWAPLACRASRSLAICVAMRCGASASNASPRVSARTSTQRLPFCCACSVPEPMS